MDIKEYESDVLRTEPDLVSEQQIQWGVNGLNSEAGEVAGILQKIVQGHGYDPGELLNELGDALYFVTYTAIKAGFGLQEVINANVAKREARYPEGFSVERSINREA